MAAAVLDVHLSHTDRPFVRGLYGRAHRLGSRLNLVERWFAELTNRKLRRYAHRSVTELETDIHKWINEWNKDQAVRLDQIRRSGRRGSQPELRKPLCQRGAAQAQSRSWNDHRA